MSDGIYRVNKDSRYFTASNEPFNDEALSWEARGVMGYLLSKPDGWTCRDADLINKGPAKETKVRRIVKELKGRGYIRRVRLRGEDGRFQWVTEVYESPSLNPDYKPEQAAKTIRGKSTSGKPKGGQSIRGQSGDIVKTEVVKTESVNTNDFKDIDIEGQPLQGGSQVTTMEQAWYSYGQQNPALNNLDDCPPDPTGNSVKGLLCATCKSKPLEPSGVGGKLCIACWKTVYQIWRDENEIIEMGEQIKANGVISGGNRALEANHPAIMAYREAFPDKRLNRAQEMIIGENISSSEVEEFIKAALMWHARDFKPHDTPRIVDYFKSGRYKQEYQPPSNGHGNRGKQVGTKPPRLIGGGSSASLQGGRE